MKKKEKRNFPQKFSPLGEFLCIMARLEGGKSDLDEIGLFLVFVVTVMVAGFFTLVEFSLLRLKRSKIRELIEIDSEEDWLQFWLRRSEKFWLT